MDDKIKDDGFYYAVETGDGVYRITSPEGVYMELLVGREKAALIDTGYGFGNLREFVEQMIQVPLVIINTHGHPDHMGANSQFVGYPIYMNQRDWGLAEEMYSRPQLENTVRVARHQPVDWETRAIADILPKEFDEEGYLSQKLPDMLPIEEGMVFDLGGISLKAVTLPGHTPGSVALLHQETGNLYLGDAVVRVVLLTMGSATTEEYQNTVRKFKELRVNEIYSGHEGRPMKMREFQPPIDCAEHLTECGIFEMPSPFEEGVVNKVLVRNGYCMEDILNPEFAAVVVDEEHFSEIMTQRKEK